MTEEVQKLCGVVSDSVAAGKINIALQSCQLLNQKYPSSYEAWHTTYQLFYKLRNPQNCLIAVDKMIAIDSGRADVFLLKLDCLVGLDRLDKAKELLLELHLSDINDISVLDQLGRFCAMLNLHEEALDLYQKCIALGELTAVIYFNVAAEQRFLGRLGEAEDSLNVALEKNPLDYEAQAMRVSLRKQTLESNYVENLESVLNSPQLPDPGKASIYYGLSKSMEDMERWDEAFSYLKQGADSRRSLLSYDVATDVSIIESIKNTFSADVFEVGSGGTQDTDPIFILGLPRTGTTLVERILSSHSEVFAAGELDTFGSELIKLIARESDSESLSREGFVRASKDLDFSLLGKNYIKNARTMVDDSPRFIDKLPFNYLYAGLIHLALPNAKIINLVRHPMATCHSIYKQLFRDAYPFSYDLSDLGEYYVAYHSLMEHWKRVIPDAIYQVAYEDVVSDMEGEARNLLGFCGLEWEDSCLDFHQNKSASTTASASQVRQKVYSSSVGKWRQYEKQLQPLADILTKAGIDIS